MRYYLYVLSSMLILVFLTGCAGMPSPQEVTAEAIDTVNQTSNVINNDIEPWMLGVIILLAGWAIPSPGEMIRGLFGFIGAIRKLWW